MAYSKFKLAEVVEKFGLTLNYTDALFAGMPKHVASDFLHTALRKNLPRALKINTEKARSELIIAPILVELQEIKEDTIAFFSGIELNIDKTKGLSGRCDFIISQSNEQSFLTQPVVTIVEAKNDNIPEGFGQCIAEMIASQIFNNKRGINQTIYGAVTNGVNWRFIRLIDKTVTIENYEKSINKLESDTEDLLGILLKMVE